MSDPDTSNPAPPLPARAVRLEQALREAGGEGELSLRAVAAELGIAYSTIRLARADLELAGRLIVTGHAGRPATYRLTVPTHPAEHPADPADSGCADPADQGVPSVPTSIPVDTPERTPVPAHAGAQFPLPTPIEPSTASDSEIPPASAHEGVPSVPTLPSVPTDTVPIGRLAVAAAVEAAAKAGRSVEGALKGRIGSAAQRLAGDGTDVATILAAARRLGDGGFTDLYTAVRAVTTTDPVRASTDPVRVEVLRDDPVDPAATLMPTGETVQVSPRIATLMRYVRGTWPRAQIDAAIWEAELGKVQERFLIASVRAIARSGAQFAPTWGEVYSKAREIGQPIVLAEQQERQHQLEQERHGPRYPR